MFLCLLSSNNMYETKFNKGSSNLHEARNKIASGSNLEAEIINTSSIIHEVKPRRSQRHKIKKNFGLDFSTTFLVERPDNIDSLLAPFAHLSPSPFVVP